MKKKLKHTERKEKKRCVSDNLMGSDLSIEMKNSPRTPRERMESQIQMLQHLHWIF